ncbi:MAG: hypothetical protein ABH873_03435 [Candidatus Firestonebacteria bacterium]
MENSQKIKDLPKVERPREKLIQYGPEKILKNFKIFKVADYLEEKV